MPKTTARIWPSVALIIYAAAGVMPLASLACGGAWYYDTESGGWREATPQDAAQTAQEIGQAVTETAQAVGAATVIPWVDLATRIVAVLAAWRLLPPKAKRQ